MTLSNMKYCIIIPHYNHTPSLKEFFPRVKACGLPIIVVDDGSDSQQLFQLTQIIGRDPQTKLLRHTHNRGKGAAVMTACRYAHTVGFTHTLQIDADGQHDTQDIEAMMRLSQAFPDDIISGQPIFDTSAPKVRVYGRRISEFFSILETFSLQIKDALCGFRIYPLKSLETITDHCFIGTRMSFDTEILVKAIWCDINIRFMETKVTYPENGVSHFHYWRDNLLLINLHIRLIAGMLIRAPRRLWKKCSDFSQQRSQMINKTRKTL